MSVHHAAAVGFAAAADRYAAGRPDYPAAVANWLRNDLALAPGATVVDLGAGTGKFLPALRNTGAALVAVEPVAAMRARIETEQPDVTVLGGTAQAIALPDASVDVVVCAQAFHWFASAEALAEIARVLRPGGRLGLIWNVRDASVAWVRRLTAILDEHQGDAPRHESGVWRRSFPAAGFGPLQERAWPHAHVGPAEAVVLDRSLSVSFIAALPPEKRAEVADALHGLVADTPELAKGGTVRFPYVTRAYWCVRDG